MTQEEKQLLIKDLCARLPYKVKGVYDRTDIKNLSICEITTHLYGEMEESFNGKEKYEFIPYLRPMSSMTEEEKKKMQALYHENTQNVFKDPDEIRAYRFYDISVVDWLNEHHFDYRGLIEKGLALESPPEMYDKEESEKESEIPVPKTVDEAISTLEKILSDEDREYLLKNGAISMHDSLGRWIRNEWGLWTGSELKDEMMNMNKGLNHPDDMSNYILEEFIKYWNNKI